MQFCNNRNTTAYQVGEDQPMCAGGGEQAPMSSCGTVKWVHVFPEPPENVSKAFKMLIFFGPTYTLVSIYPKEIETYENIYIQKCSLEFHF